MPAIGIAAASATVQNVCCFSPRTVTAASIQQPQPGSHTDMYWLRYVHDNILCGLHKCRDKHKRSRKRHLNNLQNHDTFLPTDAQDRSWLHCTCPNCTAYGVRNDTRIDIESIGVWICQSVQQKLSLSLSQNLNRSGSVHPMALATNFEAPHSLTIRII